jgi:hypothetical protein
VGELRISFNDLPREVAHQGPLEIVLAAQKDFAGHTYVHIGDGTLLHAAREPQVARIEITPQGLDETAAARRFDDVDGNQATKARDDAVAVGVGHKAVALDIDAQCVAGFLEPHEIALHALIVVFAMQLPVALGVGRQQIDVEFKPVARERKIVEQGLPEHAQIGVEQDLAEERVAERKPYPRDQMRIDQRLVVTIVGDALQRAPEPGEFVHDVREKPQIHHLMGDRKLGDRTVAARVIARRARLDRRFRRYDRGGWCALVPCGSRPGRKSCLASVQDDLLWMIWGPYAAHGPCRGPPVYSGSGRCQPDACD